MLIRFELEDVELSEPNDKVKLKVVAAFLPVLSATKEKTFLCEELHVTQDGRPFNLDEKTYPEIMELTFEKFYASLA